MSEQEFIEICRCGETSVVQFKQEFTGQREIAKEMIAFANTRGGKILFGVKDKTGEMAGLTYDEIQTISRELGNAANEQVRPTIYIDTDVVKVETKLFLVCSVAEGRNKPYKNLVGEIWVKQGADKRRVTENSEILSLFQESGAYLPERDVMPGTSVRDIEMTYVNEYFSRTFGKEKEDFGMPIESLLQSQGILSTNGELTRAGLLFFGRHPQLHMPSFVIKAVSFVGNEIGGSEYRDSRDIPGTVPWLFREGMSFLTSNLQHRQQGQNFNKVGILEVPEVVLEEVLQNSLVHLDLLDRAAIRLLIFDNRIEIINPGCLFGGLSVDDIKLGKTKQRNPLISTFASRTMIYRGLGSGISRVLREEANVELVNDESGNEFKVIIWRNIETTQTKDNVAVNVAVDLTDRQREILSFISTNVAVNVAVNTQNIANHFEVNRKTVQRDLSILISHSLIIWVGSSKTGHWEVVKP